MSVEAEASDILVKIIIEGAQYALKFTGFAAPKGLAFVLAGIRVLAEKKQLGGKVNARKFIRSFTTSEVFPLLKSDLEKLKPEMKRLHIPYMQYKSTKEMSANGMVEISVKRDDAERFIRLAESQGIASLSAYDVTVEEISEAEYEQALSEGAAKGVEVTVSDDGITINEKANPTSAPVDYSPRLEPNSTELSTNPFAMQFDFDAPISENLVTASTVAMRNNGDLIPISADKSSLFVSADDNQVILTIPGTNKEERLVVPKSDIKNFNANDGKTITADLKSEKVYDIVDKEGTLLRKASGSDIKSAGNWNTDYRPRKKKKSINVPTPTKGGAK